MSRQLTAEQREKKRANARRYAQSEKGRAAQRRYNRTEKARARMRRYSESPKGQATRHTYAEEHREQLRTHYRAYWRSGRGKAVQAAYRQTAGRKAAVQCYNHSVKGRLARRMRQQRRYARNRWKVLARAAVHYAIKTGQLVREPCAECGASPAEAHHEDYGRPLAVIWLCPVCHRRRHPKRKVVV